MSANVSIFFDESRPKRNGLCSVKIKIADPNNKRKHYATGLEYLPSDYHRIMDKDFIRDKRTPAQKDEERKILTFYNRAKEVIKALPVFTFEAFEDAFFTNRNVSNSVSLAFDKYIKQLKLEERTGSVVTYQCAKNSLESFKPDLTFAEITPSLLKKYEKCMLENGKSISSVGIYLRSLRTIYNLQDLDKSIYPFGSKKGKYSIPTSKNIKKALTLEEISKIYQYDAKPRSMADMAKDYWIFLYLCNGMNVKDFCLLKWKNIDGNIIRYDRAKTQRTAKDKKSITVALKAETMEIIRKWGRPSINPDAYIFPHLKHGMDAVRQREVCQQVTKNINKYMKRIADELNIGKEVTTYFARHSFATILKRSGVQTEMISELLGHSSLNVTENYLDSFENDQIQEKTDVLTSGFKKAK